MRGNENEDRPASNLTYTLTLLGEATVSFAFFLLRLRGTLRRKSWQLCPDRCPSNKKREEEKTKCRVEHNNCRRTKALTLLVFWWWRINEGCGLTGTMCPLLTVFCNEILKDSLRLIGRFHFLWLLLFGFLALVFVSLIIAHFGNATTS